ncbi:MAG: dephospho-CoA kinase [Patescibacteria group bacterium]|nr:dephospho-CoA kinase [Patescibacteria group bacterium]
MKIAFVGPAAVGKDVASDYIAKKFNLTHIPTGDIVREYVKKNNLGTLDRANVRIIAKKMRDEQGGDILVKIALENHPDNVVLSGLRAVDEIYTLKKLGGKVVALNAPMDKRFEWAKIRGRIGDHISFEDFKAIENKEYSDKDKNSQNVAPVMALADYEVMNDGNLDSLFKKLDAINF